jgi:biotin synthase
LKEIIDELFSTQNLDHDQLLILLSQYRNKELSEYLFQKSRTLSQKIFGNKIYIRGLIEFTNYCENNCYYCGIRRNNENVDRYRLSKEDILFCCKQGYELGFRTFVLQGGEDNFYFDELMMSIISEIKREFADCAVTLSIGEKSRETYQKYFDAGVHRYLLRHETKNKSHYEKLHPKNLSIENKIRCLYDLKEIGFQVGTGFMVGSPFQTLENIVEDVLFIKEFSPQMIGIGPFIAHKDTCFYNEKSGSTQLTLFLTAILRLMNPYALIPATTALGTIDPHGREKGILAGANVLMPNLSPVKVRKKYLLYDNKICTGEEAAECRFCLENRLKSIGYETAVSRGDYQENESK